MEARAKDEGKGCLMDGPTTCAKSHMWGKGMEIWTEAPSRVEPKVCLPASVDRSNLTELRGPPNTATLIF